MSLWGEFIVCFFSLSDLTKDCVHVFDCGVDGNTTCSNGKCTCVSGHIEKGEVCVTGNYTIPVLLTLHPMYSTHVLGH